LQAHQARLKNFQERSARREEGSLFFERGDQSLLTSVATTSRIRPAGAPGRFGKSALRAGAGGIRAANPEEQLSHAPPLVDFQV